MPIWWFDYADDGNISGFFESVSARPVQHDDHLQRGDIVFVHTETETEWDRWVECAKNSQDVHIIRMSRTPVGMGWDQQGLANVHRCDYPADSLGTYERVSQFIASAKSGNPDWDLLRLELWPECLVAAYLLMLAAATDHAFDKKRVSEHMDNNFWAVVQNEANDRDWRLDLPADWTFYSAWDGAQHRDAAAYLGQKLGELSRKNSAP